MDPRTKLAELKTEANTLLAKMDDGTFTAKDAERAREVASESSRISKSLETQARVSAQMKAISDGAPMQVNEDAPGEDSARGFHLAGKAGQAWGLQEKARHFTGGIMDAFKAAAPLIGGPAAHKALVPAGAVVAPFDGRIIEDPRQRFSLTSAVASRQANGPAGMHLRQTEREMNAASVPAGGFKPVSKFGMSPAAWRLVTIPHLSEPIRLQWLQDFPGLQQFIGQEMAYGLDAAVSQFILRGGKDEDGGEVTGLLNTSGVQQTAFNTSALRTVRASIGQLERLGVEPTHIVMAPQDWETIEVSLDGDGNYQMPNAPVDRVNQRLWGIPVVTPPDLEAGEALVGDLSTVTLLHQGSHQLTWSEATANVGTEASPQIRDLYRHNEVRFRDEVRVGLEIGSLKSYCVATLAA